MPRVMTSLLMSSTQHLASTFSMKIFKFQRHSCKLSFLFLLRHQSAPESLLTDYNNTYTFHISWFDYFQISSSEVMRIKDESPRINSHDILAIDFHQYFYSLGQERRICIFLLGLQGLNRFEISKTLLASVT